MPVSLRLSVLAVWVGHGCDGENCAHLYCLGEVVGRECEWKTIYSVKVICIS